MLFRLIHVNIAQLGAIVNHTNGSIGKTFVVYNLRFTETVTSFSRIMVTSLRIVYINRQ